MSEVKIDCEFFPICPVDCDKCPDCNMYRAALQDGNADLAMMLQDMVDSNPGISLSPEQQECIARAKANIPEYCDSDYVTPEFKHLEVIFGEHWKPDFHPEKRQEYQLCYRENDSTSKLPGHCTDDAGNTYKVRYVTNKDIMRVYLRALSHDSRPYMRLCLIPEAMSRYIPRPDAPENEKASGTYDEYCKAQKQKEQERSRAEFIRLMQSHKPVNPPLTPAMGIPEKFTSITLSAMKTLPENTGVAIPQNILDNIEAVGCFAKEYRWRHMCRLGKKVGVSMQTIAKHVPVPDGVTFTVEKDPTEPTEPMATQLELFSEQNNASAAAKDRPISVKHKAVKLDGLVLYGDMGTLKTSLAVAFLKTAIATGIECMMVNMTTFRNEYLQGTGCTKKRQKLYEVPVLLIDNLGQEQRHKLTEALITARYDQGLTTVITTTLKPEELEKKYSPALWDRLKEVSTVLQFTGSSLREAFSQIS